MSQKTPCITWVSPLIPYQKAWDLQVERVRKIASGKAQATVFFLEHPPVITMGKRGQKENLLLPEDALKAKGIECIPIDRGGDVTYHGPGQLVVYLMLPLTGADRDVHEFLRHLEEVGIRVLNDYGLPGERVPGLTGVWVDGKKIMAIGIGVKKWVTFHGLAFNFANDLNGFNLIVPCGIRDKGVTSLHLLVKRKVTREEIEDRFKYYLSEVFKLEFLPAVNPLNS